jgi:hypothetical protein
MGYAPTLDGIYGIYGILIRRGGNRIMGYKFSAKIRNKNSTMTPDDIELESFGVRKGEEIEVFKPKSVMTSFQTMREKYKGMMATDKKRKMQSKKPLTFSWFPRSDVKPNPENRCLSLSGEKPEIRVLLPK